MFAKLTNRYRQEIIFLYSPLDICITQFSRDVEHMMRLSKLSLHEIVQFKYRNLFGHH